MLPILIFIIILLFMMKKFFVYLLIILGFICFYSMPVQADEGEEWTKYLDVYNDGGLDKPVAAQDYNKALETLKNMRKKKTKKNKKLPPEPLSRNEPIKAENSNIIRIENDLYYDNNVIPSGFYKIVVKNENNEYFVNLYQGKQSIVSIQAQKIKHTDFSPNKVTALETKIIEDKYYKIMYKNIDIAICAYLAIMN